ncbi:CDP-glycerol glycerophosphotransferase family protein [Arsenophonus nasoniae]|uniref:CDP-glycerol glycerophosphotransferase family protein n=2 Tax=Arsenophonus nasoniae TaxID=638 RepID=A0A4P7KQF5_9GAMM|nr:CDP-glycerol glycerophosphotransferase family protein [Arsenophonus nasoniae]QBY42205.1 Putative CDP-glycerol:glycerophosphate glycerophosphotransferase [Arsenophonus nasoniae]WGM06360.1 CDP-glycerol glycerophosphotransferase family protein [Arsenophonus nasoniae]WGM11296.1 CDP-glycerol glycerophosphotransferase family protein [Arsenophonus nasoniae]WGM15996.1 CDP-glycerol glycerophosphotransferase family protein [Arsenophonus nasoniae]
MRRIKKLINYIMCFLLPLIYKPKKNIIIFTFDGNSFKFNTKVLFEYIILKKSQEIELRYIINDDLLREKLIKQYGNKFITTKSFSHLKIISQAKVWITDGGFPLKSPFNHKKRVLINLWHGIPLKKIGVMGYNGLEKFRVWLTLKMFSSNYSLFSSTSDNLKKIYAKSFLIKEDIVISLGQPRNDLLFYKKNKISDYIEELPLYEKVILYAPTWRKGIYGQDWKGDDTKFFPFTDFNLKKLEDFLSKKKILLLIRPHHLQQVKIEETYWIRNFSASICNEIMDVLSNFYLLITDYSSIYFDFLILEKPVLFLPYDLTLYEKNVGLNFEYNDITPGPKPKKQSEFIREIYKLLNDNSYYLKERKFTNKYFNQTVKGSSQKIYSFILRKLKEKEFV